ncbi:single-stranded DNA-binding protein [Stomatohabitans albus]|uniref:single-stranded DNA-binding protein n=1 Tax=Stomatohabitans albus TaxID=3110766 RepID=UPI00300C41FE
MAVENQITVIGNLANDPQIRYTNDGTPVTSVAVAVNRRVRNSATNEWEDQLDGFFDGTVWRDHAANVAASLKKGDRVIMIGRLVKRSYNDRDGNQRQAVDIQIDEIAPSLRWAQVQVSRNSGGRSGGGYGDASFGNAPQPAQAPAPVEQPSDDIPF